MNTPAFLLWALQFSCTLRSEQDGSEPERTERQLRGARAASDAANEGRVFEGLAIDPPYGFRVAEALTIYGGLEAASQACGGCPANLSGQKALAGCYGRVVMPVETEFHACLNAAADRVAASADDQRLLPRTAPRRWYGLWIDSPLAGRRAALTAEILSAPAALDLRWRDRLGPLIGALQAAAEGMPLHVAVYPEGHVDSGRWTVAPHCPRCNVTWIDEGAGLCPMCGFVGRAVPRKVRHAAGRRPYYPLDRLLGARAAAELLVRYEAFGARQSSPDPGPGPPGPGPPGNPPADSGS